MYRFIASCLVLLSVVTVAEAQKVRCESVDGEYRQCYIASTGKVILLTELSDLLCVEGVTWGTSSEGAVWVIRGCRGIFSVVSSTPPSPRPGNVVCESSNGGRSVCTARRSEHVTLVRQLSGSPCVEGGTWGYDPERGEIWVDRGCRGEFAYGAVDVLKPEPLDAIVVCESTKGHKKKCAADTSAGVQLFRQLDNTTCRFDEDWGWDSKQIWVKNGCRAEFAVRGKPRPLVSAIVCESTNEQLTKCPSDTEFGVAIVRDLGGNHCALGDTWGFDDKGIWVKGGCSAQFALGGYRLPEEAVPATAKRVTCESQDGAPNRCPVDTSRGVGLVHQTGRSPCVLNRTWGYDREGIWVAENCKAEFAVAR